MAAVGVAGGSRPDCVFCDPGEQPLALIELGLVRVVPDKFPLLPGHLLVITRRHHRCLAEATRAELRAVDQAAATGEAFLRDAYGGEVLRWENGIAGQSVFHAHLHLLPVPFARLPPRGLADDWLGVSGWNDITRFYAEQQRYHYAALGGDRRLLPGDGATAWALRAELARVARLEFRDGHWWRRTSPHDVVDAGVRFSRWRKR